MPALEHHSSNGALSQMFSLSPGPGSQSTNLHKCLPFSVNPPSSPRSFPAAALFFCLPLLAPLKRSLCLLSTGPPSHSVLQLFFMMNFKMIQQLRGNSRIKLPNASHPALTMINHANFAPPIFTSPYSSIEVSFIYHVPLSVISQSVL